MSDTLENLQRPENYQAARSHVYPSVQTLRWFMRQNRKELVEAGAITAPAGNWLVLPERFDQAVLEIGRRRARAGL